MAHQNKSELLNTVLQLLTEEGTAGLAEGIRLLVNEAMGRFWDALSPKMARPLGFEPKTLCLEGRCSIQLSYGRNYLKLTSL